MWRVISSMWKKLIMDATIGRELFRMARLSTAALSPFTHHHGFLGWKIFGMQLICVDLSRIIEVFIEFHGKNPFRFDKSKFIDKLEQTFVKIFI